MTFEPIQYTYSDNFNFFNSVVEYIYENATSSQQTFPENKQTNQTKKHLVGKRLVCKAICYQPNFSVVKTVYINRFKIQTTAPAIFFPTYYADIQAPPPKV